MIKKSILITATIFMCMFAPCFSVNATVPNQTTGQEQSNVMPVAEQTQWYVRVNEEGQLQKRLWSITYGVWLTDWIDVE